MELRGQGGAWELGVGTRQWNGSGELGQDLMTCPGSAAARWGGELGMGREVLRPRSNTGEHPRP